MSEETLDTDEIIEREEITEQPRRKRGRPRKSESADATFTETDIDAKPKRGRRSTKLTGHHVTEMVVMSSTLAVVSTGHPHWQIMPEECTPFAAQLADLMNRIPSKYVRAFVDMNGYVFVAMGLYNVLQPRLKMEVALRQQERMEAQRARRTDLMQQEQMTFGMPTTTNADAREQSAAWEDGGN